MLPIIRIIFKGLGEIVPVIHTALHVFGNKRLVIRHGKYYGVDLLRIGSFFGICEHAVK